jgi:uncharacterized protein (DUF488 family)
MSGRIYSVGYEGLTLEGLIDRLASANVTALVDVRLNASSRRPGFSKKRLSEALDAAGIDYIHERELGNPADNRDSFRTGDGTEGRARMRSILTNGASEALDRVIDLAAAQRIAVLCVEREQNRCHREVITGMAVERNPEIEVLQVL